MESLGKGDTWVSVKEMMNTEYPVIHPDDSLKTALQLLSESKLDTLPVVNENFILVGVLPRRRIYRALLEGVTLDEACDGYIIRSPVVVNSDLSYDQISFIVRVNKSRVGTVPVVERDGKLVGMLGKLEYLRMSLTLATKTIALLESILGGIHSGIITVDELGHILMINHTAEEMFGLHYPEIRGLYLEEVLPQIPFVPELRLGIKSVVRSTPVIYNQVPIIENNHCSGVNYVFLDISDMEQMAQELEIVKNLQTTLNAVINAGSDGVFVVDTTGSLQFVNEVGAQLLDTTPDQMVGKPLVDYIPETRLDEVARSGVPEVDVCRIKGKSCISSRVPIRKDGKPVGAVGIVYRGDNMVTGEIARKWLSLQQQVKYYREQLERQGGSDQSNFDMIITVNEEFAHIKKEAQRVARSSSTVLLTGESGVGKDMFARAIHAASPRRRRPFVKVNCAAIPETLLESELFGYAPGSFTGALKNGKPGYFEQAHEGTIFLDEIGEMPLSIQAKILQVIQEKQFVRVGGTKTQKVDVRIIAATNRNLREAMARGEFREDLYYRLNVIEFSLPSLRARPEDIIPLAEAFIQKYNAILGTQVTGITSKAQEALKQYSWPGNIRELENAIERAANYVWEGDIDIEHLPKHILLQSGKASAEKSTYKDMLKEVDKEIILETLQKTNGNKSAAARMLKLSRSAFYEKLIKYGLSDYRPKSERPVI